ncbi:MAG: fluoride efflux transporter FluC, partial [Candidatus Puniceispirillaceae bacterium]
GRFGQAGWMATLAVNLAGCCLMGIFAALLASSVYISEPLKSFLSIGFLGGLTTFSSFALDGYDFWMRSDLIGAAGYIGASVILSLASFAIAYGVVRTALGAG